MKKHKNKISSMFVISLLLVSASLTVAMAKSNTNKTSNVTTTSKKTKNSNSKTQNISDIQIIVGSKTFNATFYNNDTSKALIKQMPFTITMNELNGNEKYYDLKEKLPFKSTVKPTTIQNGEIMLWSSKTLVLFYDTFSNQYGGYVKLGYIENPQNLANALGDGNVSVTFKKAN